jgi:hypothetical protein
MSLASTGADDFLTGAYIHLKRLRCSTQWDVSINKTARNEQLILIRYTYRY